MKVLTGAAALEPAYYDVVGDYMVTTLPANIAGSFS